MFPKSQFLRLLLIFMIHGLFCIILLIFRSLATGSNDYSFLLFNLSLAWIPLILSLFINPKNNKFLNWLLFISWFLFFPNSGYLFTDLMHLGDMKSAVIWIDTLILFSFGFNALFIGSLSLEIVVTNLLQPNFGKNKSWPIILGLLYITSIGIYMGRFLRFNSWDFLFHPLQILSQTLERYSNPVLHPVALPFSIITTFILVSNYILLRGIVRK